MLQIQNLKDKGFRITKIRKGVVNTLNNFSSPVSANFIITELLKNDISANKTTIYRELDFLKSQKLIHEIDFGDGKKRYEKTNDKHHHHIVCLHCSEVEDIDSCVDLRVNDRKIEENTGFKVINHSIEFFGLCKNCK